MLIAWQIFVYFMDGGLGEQLVAELEPIFGEWDVNGQKTKLVCDGTGMVSHFWKKWQL